MWQFDFHWILLIFFFCGWSYVIVSSDFFCFYVKYLYKLKICLFDRISRKGALLHITESDITFPMNLKTSTNRMQSILKRSLKLYY